MDVLGRDEWTVRATARLRRVWPSFNAEDATELAASLWRDRGAKDRPEDAVDDEVADWNGLLDSALD
jgi:hypothetical protein